ncbi:hypothetical protein BVX95_00200 [archaeon D22]|nr:hypothetical protein BVX95_00200 [archaeon D22]
MSKQGKAMRITKKGIDFIKKHKISLIIGVASIIIIFFILSFSLKLRFTIADELTIKMSPLSDVYDISNDESVIINSTIKNENFFNCRASCEVSLFDISNNKTLYTRKRTLAHNEEIEESFIVSPKNIGEGQILYNLEVSCNNQRTFICPTEEIPRRKEAFFVLNYNLTNNEQNIKDVSKNLILSIGDKFENIKSKINITRLNIQNLKCKEADLLLDNISTDRLLTTFNVQKNLFENERYLDINQELLSYLNLTTVQILTELDLVQNITIQSYDKRNDNINASIILSNKEYLFIDNYDNFTTEEVNLRISELNFLTEEIEDSFELLDFDFSINDTLLGAQINDSISKINELNNLSFIFAAKKQSVIDGLETYNITLNQSVFCQDLNVAKGKLNISKVDELNLTNKLTNFSDEYCNNLSIIQPTQLDIGNISLYSYNFTIEPSSFTLFEKGKECCIYNECKPCNTEKNTPIIFLHGHVFNEEDSIEYSLGSFDMIQKELKDSGYVSAGEIDLSSNFKSSALDEINNPLTFKASYYYIQFYELGDYRITAQKTERIENYALRLNEIIQEVLSLTNSDNVTIIAHSMGGLVTREYIALFGKQRVDKIILINTPNHGITTSIARACKVLGNKRECEDMQESSVFLSRLNSRIETKEDLHVIRSVGCDMELDNGTIVTGDGIVTNSSAYLEGANNYLIEGFCTDNLQTDLHNNALNPSLYPETLEIIEEILNPTD